MKSTNFLDLRQTNHHILGTTTPHPFNSLFSRTTWVSQYQKGKKQSGFKWDDGVSGWQWHQLDHMQTICTSLQTDNHTNISSLSFLQADEGRDDGVLWWQWHQLDHMQTIYTSLQTDNHTNHSLLNFYRPDALPDAQTTVSIINIIINIIWRMIQQLVSLRSVCSPRLDVYFVTTICINWAAIPTTSWSWVSEAGFSEWGTTLSLDASHTTLQQSPHNQWNTHI